MLSDARAAAFRCLAARERQAQRRLPHRRRSDGRDMTDGLHPNAI
jgi:hypothetical protein